MTPKRTEKFRSVAKNRQPNLTVILENVFDTHNIGAVLRSCDSVGIGEIFVLYTEPEKQRRTLKIGKRTSAGTRKWVDIRYYHSIEKCFQAVREKYHTILATHLSTKSESLYKLDLTKPTALLFGNERLGITPETLAQVDGNFIIPQMGMAESLNISVACAVTLYEAYRQRAEKGFYTDRPVLNKTQQNDLFDEYCRRDAADEKGDQVKLIDLTNKDLK